MVDFQQFISDLVRQVSVARHGAHPSCAPRYHIRAPIMAVGPDIAIPIGLIVTEAVEQRHEPRFHGRRRAGDPHRAKESEGKEVELVIEDNGIDTNRGSLGPRVQSGFGLTLVRGLAMQLGGKAVVGAGEGGGTRVVVTFPMPRGAGGQWLASGVTARSTGVVVGLTIAVLVGTGAMLTIVHSNSAARQQRLVVSNYETLSVMRQAIDRAAGHRDSASAPIC